MALGRWQATIVDNAGNILPGATVTVRKEISGAPLAITYSDRNGTTPVSNPLTADGNGFVFFHAIGGAYRIDAVSGSSTVTWRYVPVGLSGESDAPVIDVSYLFSSTTTDSDPGSGTFRFNNATLASVTTIYIDLLDDLGSDMTTWLDRLDDAGATTDRGQLTIRAIDGSAEFIAKITGSITTATGYRKITVSYLTSTGTFSDGARATITFAPRGADGTGNVSVTGLSLVNGNVPIFSKDDGTFITDSGSKLTGRQTIYIDAAGLTLRPAASPAFSTIEYATTGFTVDVVGFDATTGEWTFFKFKAPKGWDEGTIQFQYMYMHQEGSNGGGVTFKLAAGAYSHQSPFPQQVDPATEVSLSATGNGKADTVFFSAESAVITIGVNSPPIMEGDLIVCRFRRDPTDGNDTLNVDAQILGLVIYYNTSKNTDD